MDIWHGGSLDRECEHYDHSSPRRMLVVSIRELEEIAKLSSISVLFKSLHDDATRILQDLDGGV